MDKELKKNQDLLIKKISTEFDISRGTPVPLGASLKRDGINFALFSEHATAVSLVLFATRIDESIVEFPFDPRYNRTGNIWHAFIQGLDPGIRYGYRVDGPANHIHRFNPDIVLIDPYSKALSGASEWNIVYQRKGEKKTDDITFKHRSLVVENDFDWEFDQPLNIPYSETIIYELHVRGFTKHLSSMVNNPGTFLGLIEKIPYLKDLGVTAIELLPVNEFYESETNRTNPMTGEKLLNYWGYNSIDFFAPKAAYATDGKNGNQVREFKEMVKALHSAGIEVILDIVFNHTAEGNELGTTFSYRALDNSIYYLINNETGEYYNYSGVGNTMNCNHPVVRDLILDCLRYWVTEMHVDGFRFDLAAILGRGRDGGVLSNPPLLERIAADPILADTKLIAEAWDAAGLYQVGTFPAWERWSEWNGKFRNDIRQFIKSDQGKNMDIAKRLVGSPDLYEASGRASCHSINFVTCHDGFTLSDLVSYNDKHNEANGESNVDGANDNYSWNCGYEGETESGEVNTLRQRQIKNFAVLLLMSQGVPMILAGDEMGRTQKGNNNAYCQDNDIGWINWEYLDRYSSLHRFFKLLIEFRKNNSIIKCEKYEDIRKMVSWHGLILNQPDWTHDSYTLAKRLKSGDGSEDVFLIINVHWEEHSFDLPKLENGKKWFRKADTGMLSPDDITESGKEIKLEEQSNYKTIPRSIAVLIAKGV
ncbi:MAG: glycogen debranching protein GlgX [Ignavibacteria bacterium]|nr:glycogen debranching protein GlgX [Ignavibacteria bacterium]